MADLSPDLRQALGNVRARTRRPRSASKRPPKFKHPSKGGPPRHKQSVEHARFREHRLDRQLVVYDLHVLHCLTFRQIGDALPDYKDRRGVPFEKISGKTAWMDYAAAYDTIGRDSKLTLEQRRDRLAARQDRYRRALLPKATAEKPDLKALALVLETDAQEAKLFGLYQRPDGMVPLEDALQFIRGLIRDMLALELVRQNPEAQRAIRGVILRHQRRLPAAETAEAPAETGAGER